MTEGPELATTEGTVAATTEGTAADTTEGSELVTTGGSRPATAAGAASAEEAAVAPEAVLRALNERFVDAFRQGRFDLLRPILAPGFAYLDGATAEVWTMDRYVADLTEHPQPTIHFDQVAIHVDGDVAVVSARTSTRPGQANRYVDSYRFRDGNWLCYRACVWPLEVGVE